MTKSFLLIFAVALFITAGLASAATITQTRIYGPNTPNMNGSLAFNKFNLALGTLESIQVSFTLQTSGGQLILDNDSPSAASGTFEFGAVGSITSTDVSLMDTLFLPIPGQADAYHTGAFNLTANAGDSLGDYDPTPTDGLQYDGGPETDTQSGLVNSLVWGGYTGTGAGTYNIKYSVTQWLDYGSVSGIEVAFSPVIASGGVTVIYTYTPIPEPATVSLLTIGALAFLKRKNSK
jgi:hypothetical protein